jgi:hypothetical protein
MQCNRCGAPAVVQRGDDFLCGRCGVTRDWQEVISVLQDATVVTPVAGRPAAVGAEPGPGGDPFSG